MYLPLAIVENIGLHILRRIEDDALIMIIVAVPPNLVDALLEGFQPFFEAHSGVIFVSDIQVVRPVKFMA